MHPLRHVLDHFVVVDRSVENIECADMQRARIRFAVNERSVLAAHALGKLGWRCARRRHSRLTPEIYGSVPRRPQCAACRREVKLSKSIPVRAASAFLSIVARPLSARHPNLRDVAISITCASAVACFAPSVRRMLPITFITVAIARPLGDTHGQGE